MLECSTTTDLFLNAFFLRKESEKKVVNLRLKSKKSPLKKCKKLCFKIHNCRCYTACSC